MKLLLALLLIILFSNTGLAFHRNWDSYNFNGKVRIAIDSTFTYESKFGEYKKVFYSSEKNVFDSSGNLVEYSRYNTDGSLKRKTVFKYDISGKLVKETSLGYNTNDDYMDGKTIYKYNDKDQLIDESDYDLDGSSGGKTKYKYDVNGNLLNETRYYSDGSISREVNNKYNAKNNKISVEEYDSYFKEKSKRLYRYDNNNNLIEQKYYSNGKFIYKMKYKRDKNGNCIERSEYLPSGKLSEKYVTEYDSLGNDISEKRFNSKNKLDNDFNKVNEYKYDKLNNKITWNHIIIKYKYNEYINVPSELHLYSYEYY